MRTYRLVGLIYKNQIKVAVSSAWRKRATVLTRSSVVNEFVDAVAGAMGASNRVLRLQQVLLK